MKKKEFVVNRNSIVYMWGQDNSRMNNINVVPNYCP